MVGRGGKRKGAGRKPGSKTVRTSKVALEAAEKGITPLEVMLEAMRELYEKGDKVEAAKIAKDAAPYCHPRLNAIEHKGEIGHRVTKIVRVIEKKGAGVRAAR